jgi:hypothetical protein
MAHENTMAMHLPNSQAKKATLVARATTEDANQTAKATTTKMVVGLATDMQARGGTSLRKLREEKRQQARKN